MGIFDSAITSQPITQYNMAQGPSPGATNVGTSGGTQSVQRNTSTLTYDRGVPITTNSSFYQALPYQSALFSFIDPSAFNNAANAQMGYLNDATNNVNQYLNPNTYADTTINPYVDSVTQPNLTKNIPQTTYQGASAFAPAVTDINSIMNQYTNTPLWGNMDATTSSLLNAYSNARNQYSLNALNSQGNSSGITDPSQLYGTAINNFNPYMAAGNNAASQLNTLSGGAGADAQTNAYQNILNSPVISNQLALGTKAVSQNAAAQGMLGSGELLKNLQQYGQQLAGSSIQQYTQNLLSQAGIGSSAAQEVGQLYNQQNAAEMARANQLSQLDVQQQANQFAQQQAMNAQNIAGSQLGLQAGQASAGAAGSLSQFLQSQQAADISAQQQQYQDAQQAQQTGYTLNAQTQQQNLQNQEALKQQYVNNLLNILMAKGNVAATQAYGNGQRVSAYSPVTGLVNIR